MLSLRLVLLLVVVFGLASCSAAAATPEALSNAGGASNPDWASTAEADQYWRAAAATSTMQAWIFEQNLLNVQATANTAKTATAVAMAQASSTAQVQATATAVAQAQATATMQANATATAIAAHQATQLAFAQATGTARAEHQATQTQVAVVTQAALQLQVAQAAAQRQQIQEALWLLFAVIVMAVLVYLLFRGAQVALEVFKKQGAIVRYGPHGNPLAILDARDGQVLFDPLRATGAVTLLGQGAAQASELPPADRLQYLQQLLWVLQTQARHNPFPPVPGLPETRERTRWAGYDKEKTTGALGLAAAASLAPETGPMSVTPSPLPAAGLEAQVVEGHFRELPPEGDVGAWLAEVKQKLLVAGERP